ncbi:uncharacterized protein LOC143918475 isoform X2 [Arctopsyche grandis]|uniref:uncharacterized protein LOC143918475 isoform X2 n=1 Tax=Arctopsyche grandis TaxID=121162 RepID=UPI00406D9666
MMEHLIMESDASTIVCSRCVKIVEEYYKFFLKVQESQSNFVLKNCENIKSEYETESDLHSIGIQQISFKVDDTFDIKYSNLKEDTNCENEDCNDEINETDREISNHDLNNGVAIKTTETTGDDDNIFKFVSKASFVVNDEFDPGSNIISKFPTDLIKNGKFILKPPELEKIASSFYNLRCELCENDKFSELCEMMNHYTVEHATTQGFVTCCGVRIYKTKLIILHMARHLQPSAFECKLCHKKFIRLTSLSTHLETHLPRDERSYECDLCEKRFVSRITLKQHKKQHSNPPLAPRSCEICNKSFKSSASYYVHKSIEHNSLQFLCSECGKKFKTNSAYLQHLETHDPSGKNRVPCDQCNFVSKNKASMRYHMMQHNGKRYSCDLCDFSTTKKFRVKQHIAVKHTNNKPNVCIVCGKQFKIKKSLIDHMSQHTGECRNCPYCPKKFLSSGNFYAHRKRMHGDLLKKELLKKDLERLQDMEKCKPNLTKCNEIDISMQERAREEIKKLKSQNS